MRPDEVRLFFIEYGKEHGFKVNPPASPETIAAAEAALECKFPPQMRAIYEVMDGIGQPEGWVPDLGLMPLQEVVEFHVGEIETMVPPEDRAWWHKFGVVAFWTDYNSNYIGLRVHDPVVGVVVFLDHEDCSTAPKYRNLASFLTQFIKGVADGVEWYDWPTDFPLPEEVSKDEAVARDYFWNHTGPMTEEEEICWFDSGASLVPKSQVHLVVPYLDSENMWVQEIATRMIIDGEMPGAREHLDRMALGGWANARSLALKGIAQLSGDQAFTELEAVAAKAEPEIAKEIRSTIDQYRRRVEGGFDPPFC